MSSQRPQPTLNQQLVIVTGASRGLGAAIAQAFLREGAKVVINYPVSYTHLTLPTILLV